MTPAHAARSSAMTGRAASAESARRITIPNVAASAVAVRPKRRTTPAAVCRSR